MSQGFTKNVPLDTDGTLAANSDYIAPSQKATKTYVDNSAETATSLGAVIGGAGDATPNDTDYVATALTGGGILKKITWTNVKAFLNLSNSSISPTTANQTATVNTRYLANISGLTANRNFILPSGAVGDVIELAVTTGDDTYAFIIIGDTSITINGGSTATEWSRLLITGEVVRLVATSTTNWQVIMDGRIPCQCRVSESAAQTFADSTAGNVTYNSATIDNAGGQATLTGSPDGITIRRAGNYAVSSSLQMTSATYTRLLGNVIINGGGEITRAETSGSAYESLVFVTNAYPLAVGNKLVTGIYQVSGGSRDTIANTCHMETLELL